MLRLLIGLSLILLAVLPLRLAGADEKRFGSPIAAEHYAEASRRYAGADYEHAISEALAGQAIEVRPEFSYLLGQSERMRGNCKKAIEHYQAALALVTTPSQEGVIRVQIERCEHDLAKAPASAPAPDSSSIRASVVSNRPWFRDPLGGVLVGVGGASLAAGLGMFGATYGAVHDSTESSSKFLDARSAEPVYAAGISLSAIGGALIVGGIIRYGLLARKREIR